MLIKKEQKTHRLNGHLDKKEKHSNVNQSNQFLCYEINPSAATCISKIQFIQSLGGKKIIAVLHFSLILGFSR